MEKQMAKVHELKIDHVYFDDVAEGRKRFELRKNDREFAVGDVLKLREQDCGRYTGRTCLKEVLYILKNGEKYGLQPDYIIIGL